MPFTRYERSILKKALGVHVGFFAEYEKIVICLKGLYIGYPIIFCLHPKLGPIILVKNRVLDQKWNLGPLFLHKGVPETAPSVINIFFRLQ